MGLDVYIYKMGANYAVWKQKIEAENNYSENYWNQFGEYDSISEAKKEEIRSHLKEHAESQGLDEFGDYNKEDYQTPIEIDSTLYKDHFFKIGYFRSSYNDSGISYILRDLGQKDLYELFDVNPEEYEQIFTKEQLLTTKDRILEVINVLKAQKFKLLKVHVRDSGGKINEVLPKFQAIYDQHTKNKGFNWFSSSEGDFFLENPPKIYGTIMAQESWGSPIMCLITDADYQFYIEACEIMIETINYILVNDPATFVWHWSG